MKKYLLILGLYCLAVLPSNAVLTPQDSISETYIQNHGYSAEMSRLIDLQHAQINGVETVYTNWKVECLEGNEKDLALKFFKLKSFNGKSK